MELLLQEHFNNYFTICKTKRNKTEVLQSHIIILDKLEDIKTLVLIFKENISIYRPDFANDTIILDFFENNKYIDIEAISDFSDSQDKILELCERIGIPSSFQAELLQRSSKFKKELVHKERLENVIVSESLRIPHTNVFYLQGFFHTNEIILDHKAGDHVESVILTEICRQACLSTSEEALSGQEYLIPTEDIKIYKRFVTYKHPLMIQVISGKTAKHKGYCIFTLYQNGKCCLKGCLVGKIFNTKSKFKKMRANADE